MATTPNRGWTLPVVGGSANTWGTMLNTILTDADAGFGAVLYRSGGNMTGDLGILTDSHPAVNAGDFGAALNLAVGRFFFGTVTGAVAISFGNVPAAGRVVFVMLEITNGGAHAITWPGNTRWPGGTLPVLTAAGVDLVVMYTRDAGANWRASLAQVDTR